jgi:hypothetical protein
MMDWWHLLPFVHEPFVYVQVLAIALYDINDEHTQVVHRA